MWGFRILYSVFIFTVFFAFKDELGIDQHYAITYSLGIILAAYLVEIVFRELKSYKILSAIGGAVFFLIMGYIITATLSTFFTNAAFTLSFYFVISYLGSFIGYNNYHVIENFFDRHDPKDLKNKYMELIKLIDTSTLIDGRIVDIVKTGFLEGVLVIPKFVLSELQNISDSHEHLRRQKGKRGLDVLKKLQSQKNIDVEIRDVDFKDIDAVDEKLVYLAKKVKGSIITTDYNLLKVAEIQDIKVLNVNSLTMALKQTVLPGDELNIAIIREGKEKEQGIGYLDDGSMVVVEYGKRNIGKTMKVEVTSLLQTESGRIVFGKFQ